MARFAHANRPPFQKLILVEQFDSFDCSNYVQSVPTDNGSSELERLQIHCNQSSQFLLTEVVVIDNIAEHKLLIIRNLHHSNIREKWMKKFGMLSQLTLS